MRVRLIADDKIPGLEMFSKECDITQRQGEKITATDLKNADALLVRTVTKIDKKLLENTPIRFVGTATTGVDHVNFDYLKQQNIFFADAAGANSDAVAEYVVCCVTALMEKQLLKKKGVVGIIGFGRIGSRVAAQFEKMHFEILSYDPFIETPYQTSLDHLLSQADFVTLHTPLTKTGVFPTHHMIAHHQLSIMKPGAILLNAARGSVIDENALIKADHLIRCLDVFEHEPTISLELVNKLTIATPHIAGYSWDAKMRATEMIYKKAADFFGWEKETFFLQKPPTKITYHPLVHTNNFRAALQNQEKSTAEIFTEERKIVR